MNIVNRLTIRHLRQNKRRTLVTIIGVIISVAMVTAVTTLGVSFMDLFQRQTIARDGEWHVLYKNVNKEQLKAIAEDEATKTVIISRDLGYALLRESQNENKPYLFIKEYNDRGFEQFPIKLSQGRLPQRDEEVVISEEIIENAKVDLGIGDRITLEIGERFLMVGGSGLPLNQSEQLARIDGELNEKLEIKRTQSYTIVGIIERPTWEPTWAPGYTIISYVDEGVLAENETVDASVVLKKINRSLYAHAEELAEANGIETVQFNNSLLRYYGVTNNDELHRTLYSLIGIIMTVIVIGSIALIYNAFAISVSERSRHLGMLASVGATTKQKRNSVFFEGIIIGFISIPLGIISGLTGIGVTFWCINPMIQGVFGVSEKLMLKFTLLSILLSCAVSIMTIFISVYLPAKKASKIAAIDAIRQTSDIKLTGKTVKTSKLVRRLFGIEAEIGLKNLKRNKRRYQVAVFSLMISIMLFLVVSYFNVNLLKSVELSCDGVNFDLVVTINSGNSEGDQELASIIASLEHVTEVSIIKELNLISWIEEEAVAKELQEQIKEDRSILRDGKYPYYLKIHALEEKNLKAYAKQIGVSYEELLDPENLAGIVIDTISYQDRTAKKFVETKAIRAEIGQTIDLVYSEGENQQEKYLAELKIAALTDQLPMGVLPSGLGGLNIITSDQAAERLAEENDLDMPTKLYMNSTDPIATQHQIEDLHESNNVFVYNFYQARQQEEQLMLLMSVFTSGFILLITAISIANIFNTISTSIALRKREFAMLKSVGMTPEGFNKMLNYESLFYGLKALLYSLPLSIAVMYLIYRALGYTFSYKFTLPWLSFLYVTGAVFVIVASAMLYSSSKVKNENIIEALKQENI